VLFGLLRGSGALRVTMAGRVRGGDSIVSFGPRCPEREGA
jgi:hypothetical protein